MSQEYTPVEWVDETPEQMGTLINKARLDQMQSAHHFADGFEEVDAVPTADPGVDYHKIVYCTVDKQFYRWTGSAWEKDIDDDTKALLLAHEADHANPHVVTKAQVGLGNVDNKGTVSSWQGTPDNDHIPTEKLVKDSLDTKVDLSSAQTITGSKTLSNTATFTTANLSLVLQGTAPHGTIPTSNDYKEFAYRMSGNNTNHGLITFITEAATGNGKIRIRMRDYAGANPAEFNIFSGSEKYMTGPSRTYNASNTSDVVTIGSLQASTDVVHTSGNETVAGAKTITGDITIGAVGTPTDVNMLGDLTIQGDITQNGSAYETHAEQIFTTKDYITMREGATGALSPGNYSGLEIVKYDGTNNGRLVVDASGTARVGDVGDEQPLMTRSESASMTNGNLLQWNSTSQKAVDAGVNTSQIVRGSGNIGSDTKPVKVVGGVATAVTKDLTVNESYAATATVNTAYLSGGRVYVTVFGKIAIITLQDVNLIQTGSGIQCITLDGGLRIRGQTSIPITHWGTGTIHGLMSTTSTGIAFWINSTANGIWASITVILE